jgi:hypothetical protein
MKEAWYAKRLGSIHEHLLGPFPSEEHAKAVAAWKNAEEGPGVTDWHGLWDVISWSNFYPPGQDAIRAAGLAPE